jgi:hypothetical protein
LYRNIPPHAVAFSATPEPIWTIQHAQLWDCYSYGFATLQNPILRSLSVRTKVRDSLYLGEYLFSTTHLHDGWSDAVEQDKEFTFIRLDNDRLTIQPTNKVAFIDASFILPTLSPLKTQSITHSCEE